MVEQIAFPSFAKLHFPVPTPEDVAFCGQLQYYDKVQAPADCSLACLCCWVPLLQCSPCCQQMRPGAHSRSCAGL